MLELAIKGSKKYYGWVALLLVIIGIGFLVYLKQLSFGLANRSEPGCLLGLLYRQSYLSCWCCRRGRYGCAAVLSA